MKKEIQEKSTTIEIGEQELGGKNEDIQGRHGVKGLRKCTLSTGFCIVLTFRIMVTFYKPKGNINSNIRT